MVPYKRAHLHGPPTYIHVVLERKVQVIPKSTKLYHIEEILLCLFIVWRVDLVLKSKCEEAWIIRDLAVA